MPDKTLTCRDCGRQFLFTQGEQDFYASRGFTNEPTRCPDCRALRKAERGASEGGGYTSGGYSSGGGGGGYSRREMYPATCAECGKSTQVPFMPRGDRPVYCSDCFERQRGGGSYSGRRGGGGGGRGNRW
jgi:CxxC-x17-CxxC domain-containing protein